MNCPLDGDVYASNSGYCGNPIRRPSCRARFKSCDLWRLDGLLFQQHIHDTGRHRLAEMPSL